MPEPVSVALMKTNLALEADFTDDDVYIAALTVAARRACELKTGRSLVPNSHKVVLDRFPHDAAWPQPCPPGLIDPRGGEIELPGGTVTGDPVIAYLDAAGSQQRLGADAFVLANDAIPARIAPIGRWPATAAQPGAIVISYDVSPIGPDDLALACQAIMLLVANWYTNREAAVVDTRGVPAELPLAVTWILAPLRQFATS